MSKVCTLALNYAVILVVNKVIIIIRHSFLNDKICNFPNTIIKKLILTD